MPHHFYLELACFARLCFFSAHIVFQKNINMANRLAHNTWKHRATQNAWHAASWILVALLMLIILAGCANIQPAPGTPPPKPDNTITGTARFLERTLLPANSIFEATLEEEAGAGLPTRIIGIEVKPAPGVSVVAFSIPFATSQIRPARRYAVRARVLVNGQLLFVTEQTVAVLATPQDKTVSIALRRPVPLPRSATPAPTPRAATPAPSRAPTTPPEKTPSAPSAPAARATQKNPEPSASRPNAAAQARRQNPAPAVPLVPTPSPAPPPPPTTVPPLITLPASPPAAL
jgi:uncharacterized lipoprotein YbaY